MKTKIVLYQLLKAAISVLLFYIVLVYFTDFEKTQLISEYYEVNADSPDKAFSEYQLLPLERNDFFYFESSTNNLWLQTFPIEGDTLSLSNVNYGGFYIKAFGVNENSVFKLRYDKEISRYKLIEVSDQDVRVNSLTSYIFWHVLKSLLITFVLFVLFGLFDRLLFKQNKKYYRLSLTVSFVLSLATVMIIYKSFYYALF